MHPYEGSRTHGMYVSQRSQGTIYTMIPNPAVTYVLGPYLKLENHWDQNEQNAPQGIAHRGILLKTGHPKMIKKCSKT
eukprot:745802-Amphidinium_carterae.1